ncbi:hypothetical protein ACLESD_27830, partial [Pyxidicoccus sp. 3LFB2]
MDTPFTQRLDGEAAANGMPPVAGDPFAQLLDALEPGRRVRTQGLKGAARGHVLARLHLATR